MPKFYETAEFKRLNEEWRKKLEEADFEDHEDHKGNLKQYDRKTIAWQNRARIAQFFRCLDEFMQKNPALRADHKKILSLYSQGTHIKDIAVKVGCGTTKVKVTVRHYKEVILASL